MVGAALCALNVASPVSGQEPTPAARSAPETAGLSVGLGTGLAVGGTTVAGESNSTVGPMIHARLALHTSRLFALVLESDIQPFRVENPVRAEAFRSVYLAISPQFTLSEGVYFRGGFGATVYDWSGDDVFVDSEVGISLGGAAGYEIVRSSLRLAPEVWVRWGGVPELTSRLFGLRIVVLLGR